MSYSESAVGWKIGGLNPSRDMKFFLLQNVHTDCGTHPASYSVNTRRSFLGLKRLGHEVGH